MWFSLRSAMKRAKTAWNVHSNAPNNPSDLRCKTQSDYRGQLWQQKHTETMHNRANLGCKWLQDAKIATLNFRKSWHGWNFRPGWAGSAGAMLLCDCVYLFIYIYLQSNLYVIAFFACTWHNSTTRRQHGDTVQSRHICMLSWLRKKRISCRFQTLEPVQVGFTLHSRFWTIVGSMHTCFWMLGFSVQQKRCCWFR